MLKYERLSRYIDIKTGKIDKDAVTETARDDFEKTQKMIFNFMHDYYRNRQYFGFRTDVGRRFRVDPTYRIRRIL